MIYRGKRVYVRFAGLRFALYRLEQLLSGSGAPPPRKMYDSTNLFNVPLRAQMVASYDTGYPQSHAAWARFAGKPRIHIVQKPGVYDEGDVLDIESGAATDADAHPFIENRKDQGYYRPSIYCSLDKVPDVRRATREFKLGVDYDLWVADWTGKPHIGYPGAAATQYASKQNYDLSVVNDPEWPHRREPAYPHVADGTLSLDEIAAARHVTAADIAGVTAANADLAEIVGFASYLLGGADPTEVVAAIASLVADDSATSKVMPKGTVYFTKNP